ncbi:SRPBCC family protein [Sphingobium sp. BYY-5]|uniref:SRPBCC family protein n=1 Tax=Sphingobium sp. BYY-5 TaxID=2926400 RepID=UPI001FA6ABF0|nr:SRPBCC family protein [Sphingobium sp. BYY-5]MCI4589672.1 SRPBCC family protein [Sphingobium sp. BYY-5]
MALHQARHLSISIAVPLAQAYDFAHRPENFPRWASGLASSLRRTAQGWVADTPEGPATVAFSPPNDFGILDHRVGIAGKPEVYIPLRLIENGNVTEVLFTLLRQPDMDDAAFDRDADLVRADLRALKTLLETKHSG